MIPSKPATRVALVIALFSAARGASNTSCVTDASTCNATCAGIDCQASVFGVRRDYAELGCYCEKCGESHNQTKLWSGGVCCVSNAKQCTTRTSPPYAPEGTCPISSFITGSFGSSCECCSLFSSGGAQCAGGNSLVFSIPVCTLPPTPQMPPTPKIPTPPPTPLPICPPSVKTANDCCSGSYYCRQFGAKGWSSSCGGNSNNNGVVCTCDKIVRCGPKGTNGPNPPTSPGVGVAGKVIAGLACVGVVGAVAVYRTPSLKEKVLRWTGAGGEVGPSSQGQLGEKLTAGSV